MKTIRSIVFCVVVVRRIILCCGHLMGWRKAKRPMNQVNRGWDSIRESILECHSGGT